MALTVVDIHVFGRHLKLTCPDNAIEALNHAAIDLEQRLNDVKGKSHILSSDQIVITTALNISHELNQERETVRELQEAYSKRLANLAKRLEIALNSSKLRNRSQK